LTTVSLRHENCNAKSTTVQFAGSPSYISNSNNESFALCANQKSSEA
jgi:hypothetical protein